MYNLSKLFISLFGLGFFPFAPGTLGTIASLVFFYFLIDSISFFYILIFFVLFFFITLKLISFYCLFSDKHDSSEIVIDEFMGITLIIIFYDFIKFADKLSMFILIFFLFRLFDIVKPFPANWIDKNIKNSLGILLDDIVASVYSIIILLIFNVFI